ncbi:MAG: amidoligase family protein [Janthinobacterium lividum]
MTAAQILATVGTTKTWKMQQLFALGLSRREVAGLLGVGYGFAQNVYAAWSATGRPATAPVAPRTLVTPTPFTPGALTRTFGVEIEAFGVTRAALLAELRAQGLEAQDAGYTHSTTSHWKIVSDGSITGANSFELVSPILRGLEGLAELEKACRALKICNAQVNSSCGLHVHFGATDLSLEPLRQLVRNYLVLEPTIDQLMPAARRANNATYCLGLLRGRTQAEAERAILTATSPEALATAANGGSRYHKVNLQSYFRQRTVEFRQHSGSTDYEKISMWVKFLHNLIDYSCQHLATPALPVEQLTTFNQRDIATYYQRRRTVLATR